MPTLTYPGVYIEELSSGVHTITGVATSIAAFIGWAPQGPTNQATLIQSWADYQALFGGLDRAASWAYSVNQFFANGGTQAYIVRLAGSFPLSPRPGPILRRAPRPLLPVWDMPPQRFPPLSAPSSRRPSP
jgi:phage tail sheath protein FI